MVDPKKRDKFPVGMLSQETRDEFEDRLDKLGKKLDKATGKDHGDQTEQSRKNGIGIAMRMGSEFVVAVLIGGAMGWYLDEWLGSTPFMLFLFILFGFAAGTMNIIRAGKQLDMVREQEASNEANANKTKER